MEYWTGIISGTNRGLVFLNFEVDKENRLSGTFQLFDAEGMNLSAKVNGSIKANSLEAQMFDFTPRQKGVPGKGTVSLTMSEDQKEMKGQWQTDIDTQGECILCRFPTAQRPAIDEQPKLTLETKDISISFCSFDKKNIEDIIGIMTKIAKSIREGKESNVLPPIYSIMYDKEERIRTYSMESFLNKFREANKIWHIGFELKANDTLKKIFINLHYQQSFAPSLRSNVLVEDTESAIVTMIPEMVRGLVSKAKNKHFFYHHWLFEAVVQILGVITILAIALLVSGKFAPSFPGEPENTNVYIFMVALIVLSNLWTYSFRLLFNTIHRAFPVVEINNKPKARIIPGLLVAIIATIFASGASEKLVSLQTIIQK